MNDVALPPLGIGTAALGNLYTPVSDAQAEAAVRTALDLGITYFDTAPFYGFGLAERRLGQALGDAQVLISTKVGRLLDPIPDGRGLRHGYADADPFEPRFDYGADAIRRSHESSLVRLQRDRVDILLAHDLGQLTHGEDHPRHLRDFLEGGYRAMRDLKDAGAIQAIGIGVNEIAICLELIERVELDVILLAGRYSLLDRSAAERLIPECGRRGVRLIIGGPYNSGILARDDLGTTETLHYDYAQAPAEIVARARALAGLCARFGVRLPAAALQFPLRDPRVSTVIAGVANAREVEELVERAGAAIPDQVWAKLREEECEA
jgi:D-threo-aldose 1-dehydrogenase